MVSDMYWSVGMLFDGRSWLRPSLKPFSLPSLLSIRRAGCELILLHRANVILYVDGTFHSSELCEALGLPWGFAYLRYAISVSDMYWSVGMLFDGRSWLRPSL